MERLDNKMRPPPPPSLQTPLRGGQAPKGTYLRTTKYCALLGLFVVGGSLVLGWAFLWRSASDPAATLLLTGTWDTKYRVFGPAPQGNVIITEPSLDYISFRIFTKDDQRDFLIQFGQHCQKDFTQSAENVILQRFEELPEPYAVELWKYCVLYTGVGNVYWESDNLVPLVLWEDMLPRSRSDENIAIALESAVENASEGGKRLGLRLHHSFLHITNAHSKVCVGMMRYLTESKFLLDARQLSQNLGLYVSHDKSKKTKEKKDNLNRNKWKILRARCLGFAEDVELAKQTDAFIIQTKGLTGRKIAGLGNQCPVDHEGPCCQVIDPNPTELIGNWPIMVLRHPLLTHTQKFKLELPYSFQNRSASEMTFEKLGTRVEDVPYIATVREYFTGAPPATQFETPNFFDILRGNGCLPQDKDCFKCLKTGYEGQDGGDCNLCRDQCPCYCTALCKIRPPPKRLVAKWEVKRPRYRRDPTRIVPRIVHQTWFEPVTKEKYPNMSRLIESFRQSGWQYEFYDDDRAAQFISAHFPPQVREAYDAIIPGAFKADLFRYCVLLIVGGVYADMDILLESNLDESVHPTVGFMVPQDSPGMTIGHRHCLWNGLMAAAPGHPFLAKTVENVVNNVRNRFTSVDYDDMLCPNPVLAVSHTVDTLFTAGPCILGASLNDVLKRHRQTGFDYGDIDLFLTERQEGKVTIDPVDDPRFLIPGRSIILKQNKEDMGCHRFTWDEMNMIVAATDMPDYDDRPPSLEHYSKTHEKFGIYGLHKLYTNSNRANEEFTITVLP